MRFCPFLDDCAAAEIELPDPEERIRMPIIPAGRDSLHHGSLYSNAPKYVTVFAPLL